MYYYFCSSQISALKINGVFYGILTQEIKPLRVDAGTPFIELCPVSVKEPCLNFILDDEFFIHPPEEVILTDLKGGYLIKFNSTPKKSEFFVLSQKKTNHVVATVFNENGLHASIETPNDFYAETLKFACEKAEIFEFFINSHPMLGIEFFGQNHTLIVYSIGGKIEKIFEREIESFSLDNGLKTVEKFSDIKKHSVTSVWDYMDEKLQIVEREISFSKNFLIENLNEKILPFAFLESLLVGEDVGEYLSENIMKNRSFLKGYLGEFIGVMPPPKFRNEDEVGLIYKKSENTYQVEYFTFTLENRKINNIKKIDN